MNERVESAWSRDSRRVVVEWIMSSICNYACRYCPAYLHNNRVRWPELQAATGFCERVVEHYRGSDVTFLLSGGEITLYPQLRPFVEHLQHLAADVAIITNGSRPTRWWYEHADLFDEVILSYHHERADDDHLIGVAQVLSSHCRVQINVVIDPGAFDRTMRFAARAERETRAAVNRKIMFEDGWKRRTSYADDQQSLLSQMLAWEQRHRRHTAEQVSVLKGDLVLRGRDGGIRKMTALQLIDEGLNNWKGWRCSIGRETLFIRFDEVWRAACRVGGRIGTIYDRDLTLPASDVECSADDCNCIGGIVASKRAPTGVRRVHR